MVRGSSERRSYRVGARRALRTPERRRRSRRRIRKISVTTTNMSTYLEAQDELLDWINRPASEMRTRVKSVINQTILWMQRKHQFQFSERLIKVTYPANSLKINIATACDGRPRDYKNIQLLGNLDANEGLNLFMKTYSQIMNDKMKNNRLSTGHAFQCENDVNTIPNDAGRYASYVTTTHRHFVFTNGSDIGLYPTPASDRFLLINLHTFQDTLSADDDTNFLLDNCYDFIILKALKRMNIFLKSEGRIPIPAEEVADAWDSIMVWDSQVMVSDQHSI